MTKIIAEIGWNHMGNMELAEKMISEAKKSGADYAKFQTWSVKNLKSGSWDKDGRREIYEKAQLTHEKHLELINICKKYDINFLTSVFNSNDVEFVSTLINSVKIPSSEMNNKELIDSIIKYFKPLDNHHIFISTGSSLFSEILNVIEIFKKNNMNFSILHCVSSYPCPYDKCNLDRINELKKCHTSTGYSGHCPGIFDAIASLEYNIDVIEKHFTIDNELPGRDNKFAILPDDLKFLCDYNKNRNDLKKFVSLDYQESEKDNRENYSGRWCK
jgi:N,N'-diacetyllegionaminate synthase